MRPVTEIRILVDDVCIRGHVNPPRSNIGACIPCGKLRSREYYKNNAERVKSNTLRYHKEKPEERRDTQRAHRLKVPVAVVREAIARAQGRCEACGKELSHAKMCIDHNHATGQIRGVLCRFCNALEGMLNKQEDRVAKVQQYLQRASQRLIGSLETL